MKLTLQNAHLSIRELPETELPKFTVITGQNGAGKSHLLKAVEEGKVAVDIARNPKEDVRFFDWNNLVPNNSGSANTSQLYSEQTQILNWGLAARRETTAKLTDALRPLGIHSHWTRDPWELVRLPKERLEEIFGDEDLASKVKVTLSAIAKEASQYIKKHVGNNEALQYRLKEISRGDEELWPVLKPEDFERRPFGWGQVDWFQQSFAMMFLGYFELVKLNKLYELDRREGRLGPERLSDEEFLKEHGKPPWEFVNEVLRNAGLDFSIDHPTSYQTIDFSPKLTKTTSGAEIQFSDLSSGEKILMSFAFCLYYSVDTRQIVKRPKLLLFDEIDAPLHPSMSRMLVDTICSSLVERYDTHVIFATHSPSTVAVVPDESLHVMRADEPGVHKVSKRQAIAVLTSGIPTLSIDFDGRRQVFVESDLDADRYQRLYHTLSERLASERSLVFIGVGRRSGDRVVANAGCDQVKQIVESLRDGGNMSVFGLIDWDTENEPDERIVVLAYRERYAIENCLLDPLLLAGLVIREDRSELGLEENEGYRDFCKMAPERLQEIVDRVQRRVLALDDAAEIPDRTEVMYTGGFSLTIAKAYLQKNGHDLEESVREVFPKLRRFHNVGELLLNIVDPIIAEAPNYVPQTVVAALEELLHYEIK